MCTSHKSSPRPDPVRAGLSRLQHVFLLLLPTFELNGPKQHALCHRRAVEAGFSHECGMRKTGIFQ